MDVSPNVSASTDTCRSARVVRRCPPSKIGCENESVSRHVRDGWNSPAGVMSCGSSDAVPVGNQSLLLSATTRCAASSLQRLALHIRPHGHPRRGIRALIEPGFTQRALNIERRLVAGVHGSVRGKDDAERFLRASKRQAGVLQPRFVARYALVCPQLVEPGPRAGLKTAGRVLQMGA